MGGHLPETRNSAESVDHLYIVCSDGGMVKIGRSLDPTSRMASLRTGTGHRLTLVRVLRGMGYQETRVHRAMHRWRLQGEWFKDTRNFREQLSATLGVKIDFGRRTCVVEPDPSGNMLAIRALCDGIRGRPANPEELAAYAADDLFWEGGCSLEERNAAYVKAGWPTMSKADAALGP